MAATKINIGELVEQMPETDRDIQARKDAEKQQPVDPNAKPKETPKADRWGAASKFTGPDPDLANKLFAQALAGEKETLAALMALIRDPADAEFKNYKPEYFLHGLAIYVSAPEREAQKKWFVETLAAHATNPKIEPHVRGFLVRELRVIGEKETVAALGKLLRDEQLCADAAAALVSIGDNATEQFHAALPNAKGKCRVIIVQSLGVLRDAKSAGALRAALNDNDPDVRLAAAWGLARITDASSIEPMLKATGADSSWERTKAIQACLLLAENLAQAGKRNDAARIYSHIRATRTEAKEQYLRDAATKALSALGMG